MLVRVYRQKPAQILDDLWNGKGILKAFPENNISGLIIIKKKKILRKFFNDLIILTGTI